MAFIAHGIGCIVLCKIVIEIGKFIHCCFIRQGKNLKKYGEWAIVTGATDGIGKAIAMELSKQGMKILLVSRTQEKLDETKKELKTEADTCAIDFSDFGEAKRAQMKKAMEGKDIGVVVNNVGISYDHPEFFHDLDADRVEKIIRMNIDSTTWMCHMALPKMLEKKKGCIVNIASISAVISCPLLAQYSAAKEYIIRLTQGLSAEYEAKGIDIQVQYPAFVTTKLAKIRSASLTVPNPSDFAKASVKAFGYESEISPFWAHYIMAGLSKWLPSFAQDKISMMQHLPLRKRALAKKADATKKQ